MFCLCATLGLALGACSPASPDEEGSDPPLAGQTTDSFSIQINQVSSDGRPGLPIADCTVYTEFVDTDNLDPQTGQYAVRATRVGVTNTNGQWSTTVSYHGEGNLAANGVNFRITHPDYDPYQGVAALHNHAAATDIQLTQR
jgi:hypothetical protein